jgi:protein-disulfide isomerase
MPVLPLLSLLLCSLLLSSCTSTETPSLSKGTGQYPNSIYVNTVSKDLDSVHVGNASSPVQLTIFTDYQCPACAVFHTGVENRLWKDYIETNKIGVTFMNYPLTMTNAKGKPVHPNAE